MQQLRDPFILREQLRILLQHHFHFLLEFADFLALCLQDGVFLFEHDEVGSEQLLDAVGVLIELVADDLSAGTGLLNGGPKVTASLSHLTDLSIYYISITLTLFIICSFSTC